MYRIFRYINDYFRLASRKQVLLVSFLAALLIFINYHFALEQWISQQQWLLKYFCWLLIFSVAWLIPLALASRHIIPPLLLIFPPALFALKMVLNPILHFSDDAVWNNYWNHVFYWPFLLIVIGGLLLLSGKWYAHEQLFYGGKLKGMDWKPYLLMLLIMLPLVASASTQPDFQAMYPKLRGIEGLYAGRTIHWWQKLLFEISYGSDFITIEFFFRGFLVLAFARWVGKDAILAMACFYCTIHFGKPLGECISSYFGGLILGIVVYNTRSIFGGLMVHLGIAWMMELFGYLGS